MLRSGVMIDSLSLLSFSDADGLANRLEKIDGSTGEFDMSNDRCESNDADPNDLGSSGEIGNSCIVFDSFIFFRGVAFVVEEGGLPLFPALLAE